jgi:pimeloyl-ACP methyl ester carboxylesterase
MIASAKEGQSMGKTLAHAANGGVRLPITNSGAGQKVIFFNGMGATQASWKNVARRLKGKYDIATFDFRGHGRASDSPIHSFEAFLSDVTCAMAAIGAKRPIVVGWSMGADLAVAYAAAHPGELGGLFLIDGGVPLSEPMTRDEAVLRKRMRSPAMALGVWLMKLNPNGYRFSGDELVDVALSVGAYRQQLLDVYDRVDCPIAMALATKAFGKDNTDETRRKNRLWREGAERLAACHPGIGMTWVDAGHLFPLSKPAVVAQMIDAFVDATAEAAARRPGT